MAAAMLAARCAPQTDSRGRRRGGCQRAGGAARQRRLPVKLGPPVGVGIKAELEKEAVVVHILLRVDLPACGRVRMDGGSGKRRGGACCTANFVSRQHDGLKVILLHRQLSPGAAARTE
eukprot:365016-Chlamydomonas_euryale.AAC.10